MDWVILTYLNTLIWTIVSIGVGFRSLSGLTVILSRSFNSFAASNRLPYRIAPYLAVLFLLIDSDHCPHRTSMFNVAASLNNALLGQIEWILKYCICATIFLFPVDVLNSALSVVQSMGHCLITWWCFKHLHNYIPELSAVFPSLHNAENDVL